MYETLTEQLKAITNDVDDNISNLANASALLYNALENINWAGFYIMKGDTLYVGPFMGKPACVKIALGRGVCGTAAATSETQLVPDVHEFPGHIACDPNSRSEIVIPLFVKGTLYGVLDIDSPITSRFSVEDKEGLEAFARVLEGVLRP